LKTQVLYHRERAWGIGFEKSGTRITAWLLMFFCGLILLVTVLPNQGYTQEKPPLTQVASKETLKINTPPPTPSGPGRWVNDYDHLLTSEDTSTLLQTFGSLAQQGKAEIVLVTLPDSDRPLSELATDILNQWKIGEVGKSNGVLILINGHNIKTHAHTGRIFIGVKTGLQGILPDAVVGRFIRKEATPAFNEGKASTGITSVGLALAQFIDQQITGNLSKHTSKQGDPIQFLYILIAFFIVLSIIKRFSKNSDYANNGDSYMGGGSWFGGGGDSSGWGDSGGGDFGGDSGGGDGGGAGD
jgi:uncharacterized protein